MKLPLYQLDAFTDRLFGGNPAALISRLRRDQSQSRALRD